MSRTPFLVFLSTFLTLWIFPISTLAQDDESPELEEKKLWAETGQMVYGVIERQDGPAVPSEELEEVDYESLKQVEKRWEKLLNKSSRGIPPLKYIVPVPKNAEPSSPPSDVGSLIRAPNDFIFFKNTHPSSVAGAGFSSIVNEPSVVAVGDHVFYTGNWYAASSSNEGDTFSFVNPFTGPFAPAGNGFCCDQVTSYDPAANSIFYLQQYIENGSTGVQRINVDQGADGTYDCFYDVQPSLFGFGAGSWADFPDLAVSNGHLYHSTNVFQTGAGSFLGAFVARFPLSQISQCAGSVAFDVYTDTSGFFSFKLTRGATDTMYFADHISTASVRIWRWPERSAAPVSFDRAVSAWSDSPRSCPDPGGHNGCGFIDRRMAGAYVADGVVGFMWMPSQDATFSFPYVRIARFSSLTLSLISEPLIWSSGFAWAYPSVAVNRNGDLGGTVMAGGGTTLYPSCVAWIADDANSDTLAPLENQVALFGTDGPSINRSGDYNSTSAYYPNNRIWAGACFTYLSTSAGHARYLLFGREKDANLVFEDGFASGNLNAWTVKVP